MENEIKLAVTHEETSVVPGGSAKNEETGATLVTPSSKLQPSPSGAPAAYVAKAATIAGIVALTAVPEAAAQGDSSDAGDGGDPGDTGVCVNDSASADAADMTSDLPADLPDTADFNEDTPPTDNPSDSFGFE